MNWDWSKFKGSAEALRYNKRELGHLEYIVGTYVNERRAVIQAGGNLGIFPKFLANCFKAVYTFEPAPDLFNMLIYNAPEANIIKIQAALGNEKKLINVSRVRRDGKPNNHEGITHVSGEGIIPILTIDDLKLPVCDLIYLDIEGYELMAILGGLQTIRKCRPVIVCEINKQLQYVGLTADEIRFRIIAERYKWVTWVGSDEVFVPEESI